MKRQTFHIPCLFPSPGLLGTEKTAGDPQGHSLASLGFHSVHFFDEYQRSEHFKTFSLKQSLHAQSIEDFKSHHIFDSFFLDKSLESYYNNDEQRKNRRRIPVKLLFKQRLFSWFDSYDIYTETGEIAYTVKGQFAWGHCLKIFDCTGNEVGTVRERVISFLPKFEIYLKDRYLGCICKEFSFFRPKFHIDCNGWQVEGDFFEWDYHILDSSGYCIATISKELFHLTDTYTIEVNDDRQALSVLMMVLAIDAEKCSRGN